MCLLVNSFTVNSEIHFESNYASLFSRKGCLKLKHSIWSKSRITNRVLEWWIRIWSPSAGHVIFKFQHLVKQKLSRGIFTHNKGIHLHSPLEFGEFWVQIRQACKVQINLEYVFCGNRISIGVDETSSWFMLALYTNVSMFFARGLLASSSTAQRFWTGFLLYTSTHLTSAFLFLKSKRRVSCMYTL